MCIYNVKETLYLHVVQWRRSNGLMIKLPEDRMRCDTIGIWNNFVQKKKKHKSKSAAHLHEKVRTGGELYRLHLCKWYTQTSSPTIIIRMFRLMWESDSIFSQLSLNPMKTSKLSSVVCIRTRHRFAQMIKNTFHRFAMLHV